MTELTNIRNIMKLKHYGIAEDNLKKFIIGEPKGIVSRLMILKYEECIKLLETEKKELSLNVSKNIKNLENNMEKILLKQASKLLHLNPLSISPIFGYLIKKEAEIRNIRLLINAKITELENDFVEENMIV